MKEKKRLPFISISQETSLVNKTGSWRTQKPEYQRGISPCQDSCLSGQDIPCWMNLVKNGNFEIAYKEILKSNPFPSLTGRVCPHPCEKECNRGQFDEPLAINTLERFIGDWGLENITETFPKISKKEKMAIIGSGPAGLSCAYYLRKAGYEITIFEALPVIGGVMAYGIPEFRLTKEVLKKEIEKKILVPGIEVKTTAYVSKAAFGMLLTEFDAVFVATGLSKSKAINLPGEYSFGVLKGIDLLKNINLGFKPQLGEKVIVIGGGNTAIDAARSLKRFGSEVSIFYRRTKKEMPALKDEISAAEKEGIKIQELISPVRIITKEGGRVDFLECQKMKLVEPDTSGRRKPVPMEGLNFLVQVNAIIFAIGEEKDASFLPEDWETNGKIFIGGDFSDKAGTVAAAIKSGREKAEEIASYLRGEQNNRQQTTNNKQLIKFEDLNLDYFIHQLRIRDFGSLAPEFLAESEAKRCFSCGFCPATAGSRLGGDNLCENCYKFCPDVAVIKKNGKLEINYDYCKGCGVCAEECPTKSIILKLEQSASAEVSARLEEEIK